MTKPNSRLINVDMEINEIKEEEKKEAEPIAKQEKEIFMDDQKQADLKKQKLKEHLARCREKSAKVRAEKKAQRLANKKPRGRPKKVKEEPPPQVAEEEPAPVKQEPVKQEVAEPPNYRIEDEEEEIDDNDPMLDIMGMFDEDRIADKVFNKMKAYKEQTRAEKQKQKEANMMAYQPPQPQYTQSQILAFEKSIREDEQRKMSAKLKAEKTKRLQNATTKYFDGLPPVNIPNDPWDNLFKLK